MPLYQIHKLRESRRQQFRWAPHTSGTSIVKPHDYEEVSTVTAETPYAAWLALRGTDRQLHPGDILVDDGGRMSIYKYVGFEEARWFVPEPAAASDSAEVATETPADLGAENTRA